MVRARGFLPLVLLFVVGAATVFGAASAGAAEGKEIYLKHCAVCHGENGDGRGPESHRLGTKPADLRSGVFKFRSTPSGSLPQDADLLRTLTTGIPGTAMIAQTHLSEEERWAVARYVKTLSDRFTNASPAPPIPVPPVPADLPSLVEKGKHLYAEAGCPTCHGQDGRGDGAAADSLKDAWGRPSRPADLTNRPLKSGPSPQDLYRTLVTGLNGTAMPSYHDALGEEELWSVVAYVETLAEVGPGGKPGMTGLREEHLGRVIEMMNRMRMQGQACCMR